MWSVVTAFCFSCHVTENFKTMNLLGRLTLRRFNEKPNSTSTCGKTTAINLNARRLVPQMCALWQYLKVVRSEPHCARVWGNKERESACESLTTDRQTTNPARWERRRDVTGGRENRNLLFCHHKLFIELRCVLMLSVELSFSCYGGRKSRETGLGLFFPQVFSVCLHLPTFWVAEKTITIQTEAENGLKQP